MTDRPRAAGRRNRLVVMLKQPVAGRVKTRLGRDIGMSAAANWYRGQSARLLRRLGGDPRWQLHLSVAPAPRALTARCWPAHLPRQGQAGADLGVRMRHALDSLPPGPAVLVGSDVPGITPAMIARAFAALGSHDVVFGPAADGGFWLVGLRRGAGPVPRGLFENVRWSVDTTLAQTLAGLETGTRVAMIDRLRDVDHLPDLRAARTAAAP